MRNGLMIASAVALLTTAPVPGPGEDRQAPAPATEQRTLPQSSTPRSSERVQPVPRARTSDTTGTISAKPDSDARRVTDSVGRTLERMEEMFRSDGP